MNRIIIFLILCQFSFTLAIAQSRNLDSLLFQTISEVDTTRIQSLLKTAAYYEGINLDSTLLYARRGLSDALVVENDSLAADAYHLISIAHQKKSIYDSSIYYLQIEEPLRIDLKDDLKLGNIYNDLGIIADEQGDFKVATDQYIKALKLYESLPDSGRMAIVYVNLGVIYKSQNEFQKALDSYNRAIKIFDARNQKVNLVVTTGNIGSVLNNLGQYDLAISKSEQARKGYIDLGYPRYAAYPISNMAIAYDSLGNYEEANKLYENSIAIHKEHKNLYEIANISNAYAQCLMKQSKSSQALKMALQALSFAEQSKSYELIVEAQFNSGKAYAAKGNYRPAYLLQQKARVGRDSIFNRERTEAIFAAEEKWNVEKKEKQLVETRAVLAESQLNVQKKNQQIYGVLGLAIILGLLGSLFYNQQKIKNAQLQKDKELQLAMAKIENQNKLNEQRLRISRDLHDNIGAQLTFVISSLDNMKYGYDLDYKINERIDGIGEFTRSTIGELRDTIWAMNKDDISMDDLQSRINNFIDQAELAQDNIQFDFNTDPELQDVSLSSVQGMNVYRIIQESVNNGIKYANADHITINIQQDEQRISVVISDDGDGFDLDQIERGSGLTNMEKRAVDISAELNVDSQRNGGTTISLYLPKS